ncbi:MAG TPA: 2,3-diphosphoglycerate-dependent phosphoglycerate mutase [Acidimicrobiales bacterium]|nr:2,3-diphosphoglycerate-dependent phosphoglycerate mutase [Acidimicrobiales bacterium]
MPTLVLLRHGQSTWNAENRFTGWTDVDLTFQGAAEAMLAGELLREADHVADVTVLHTSVLSRAARTAAVACESMGRSWIPVRRHWRLNERHYGDLQGMDKREATERFGADQVKLWRRSFDIPPPALADGDSRHPSSDPRYRKVPASMLPSTECLADVLVRMMPYWVDSIVPDLLGGESVFVVAHGNSLRALIKHLDHISDKDIIEVEIPTGIPLVYELDDDLEPIRNVPLIDRYLGDIDLVRSAQDAVARQADAP